MIIIRFLFFAIISLSINSSLKGQDITPELFYNFLNEILPSSRNNPILLSKIAANDRLLRDTNLIFNDSIFSDSDKDFMRKQLLSYSKFKWKKGVIRNTIIIRKYNNNLPYNNRLKWKAKFEEKYGRGFRECSIPIFSLDRKYCVIYNYHSYLYGGSGGLDLYKREGNQWIFYSYYYLIMS